MSWPLVQNFGPYSRAGPTDVSGQDQRWSYLCQIKEGYVIIGLNSLEYFHQPVTQNNLTHWRSRCENCTWTLPQVRHWEWCQVLEAACCWKRYRLTLCRCGDGIGQEVPWVVWGSWPQESTLPSDFGHGGLFSWVHNSHFSWKILLFMLMGG